MVWGGGDEGFGLGGLLIRDVSVLMLRSSSLEVFRGYPLLLDVVLVSDTMFLLWLVDSLNILM